MILQKNYKAYLTSTLSNGNIGELEVRLNIAPLSDMGFLLFEPGTNNEETCLYHRKSGNSVFIYGVNRDNAVEHKINTSVMLTNSIDSLNYLLGHVGQAMYIYKKDTKNVIIKGGTFYINNIKTIINDIDTSVLSEDQILIPNCTNHVYIKDGKYYIDDDTWNYFPVADIIVDGSGIIQSITRVKFTDIFYEGGFAPLDELGKVPFQYLPAIFGTIQEYNSINDFPLEGETGIIYTVLGSALGYRWTGTSYMPMGGIGDLFSANNLSDLDSNIEARDNLNVYSQTECDDMFVRQFNNLSDLDSITEARTNLDVYSKSETESLVESGIYETFTAGEDMVENDFFRYGVSGTTEEFSITNSTTSILVGSGTHIQSFKTLNRVNGITGFTIYGSSNYNNSGSVSLKTLSGTVLFTSSYNFWSQGNTINFTFTKITLTPNTTYKIEIIGYDLTYLQGNTSNNYPDGSLYINGVISNNDARIKFNFTKDEEDVNKVYKAYANTFIKSKVEGIVSSNVNNGNTFKGLLGGIKGGFTGLSGELLLQNDGSIGNNRGEYYCKVGEQLTSTKLFFKKPFLKLIPGDLNLLSSYAITTQGSSSGTLYTSNVSGFAKLSLGGTNLNSGYNTYGGFTVSIYQLGKVLLSRTFNPGDSLTITTDVNLYPGVPITWECSSFETTNNYNSSIITLTSDYIYS